MKPTGNSKQDKEINALQKDEYGLYIHTPSYPQYRANVVIAKILKELYETNRKVPKRF